MSLAAAVSGFVVFILSIQVIQGWDAWGVSFTPTTVCALKGTTVEMRCNYRHPTSRRVTKTFWFVNKGYYTELVDLTTSSHYAGRAESSCHDKSCTLRITDLREDDTAEYKFRFITNIGSYSSRGSVTLTVTGFQVEGMNSYSPVKLECRSSCLVPNNPSYIWYKNGQEIVGETLRFHLLKNNYAESYSCALREHEDLLSPLVCARGQTCNSVTYTKRSICALKGSSVGISCTYSSNRYITSRFWFILEPSLQWQSPSQPKDSQNSQYADRVQVIDYSSIYSTLRITDLRVSDSGHYRFKFKTRYSEWGSSLPGTTLNVTALQVQVIRATESRDLIWAELQCQSSCRPDGLLSYVWFNNEVKIGESESSSYARWFRINDNISCAVRAHEALRSPSVYLPKPPFVSRSPSGEILEGSSVNLTCSSDANPAAKYTWYKENNPDLQLPSEEPQLVFRSIQSSESGEYYCAAVNELGRRTSESISVDVKYGPKTSSVSVRPSAEILEGSSVTLTCSSDANPAASYTWYKENQTLSQGPEGIYRFTSISSEDKGIYYCKSENEIGSINSTSVRIDVQYAPKLVVVSVSPSGVIAVGSLVNLTCSSDANPAPNYTWYKENEDTPKGSGQIFTIIEVGPEHSGNYYCEAQNSRGYHNSTLNLSVVAGSVLSAAAGWITVVCLAVIFISVFLLMSRRKSWKNTTKRPDVEPQPKTGSPTDIPSAALQGKRAAEKDDLCYSNVTFSNNQEAIYSNVSLIHNNEEDEEEDGVEYTDVVFRGVGTSPKCEEPVEDPSALYSTVAKKPRA